MDQQLQVFITVADRQNFSRAAEDLHMTQPAVSQYIRTLEESFGVRLLERNSKYVKLNQAGKIVYHHAKEINGLHSRMQHLVEDLTTNASGPLSVGASYSFGEYVLPHIIASMKKRYPPIQPTVKIGNTTDIANAVLHHQLDIGIVEGHFKEDKSLQITAFAEDEMVIVANPKHPLATRTTIQPHELMKETWILRESGSGTREATEQLFNNLGISPINKMYFGSTQSIKGVITSGLGISLLSKWVIQKELASGDLQIINMMGLPFTREFSFVTSSPFQTKALQTFISFLQQKELTVLAKNH